MSFHRARRRPDCDDEYHAVRGRFDERVIRLNRLPDARSVPVTGFRAAADMLSIWSPSKVLRGEADGSDACAKVSGHGRLESPCGARAMTS